MNLVKFNFKFFKKKKKIVLLENKFNENFLHLKTFWKKKENWANGNADACTISLLKILEAERSRFRLLENSIEISLLFVYFVHVACCCVCLLVYIFFSLIIVVVGLLGTSSMYLLMMLLFIG